MTLQRDLDRICAGEHPFVVLDGDERHYDGGMLAFAIYTRPQGFLMLCMTTIAVDGQGRLLARIVRLPTRAS